MAAGISTRNRATMEKSSLFVEVESLCGATGYPLRTPRVEDTVLDAHTREPITVITERYLSVLRFCRWSQPGLNQKLAHLIPEIRVERSHLMFGVLSLSHESFRGAFAKLSRSLQEASVGMAEAFSARDVFMKRS